MVSDIQPNPAHQAEEARDLRKQLGAVSLDMDDQFFIFKETSPARRTYPLYSMEDGSQVNVFRYRLEGYLNQTMPDGTPRFTSHKELAPPFVEGQLKCFLAEGSPERETVTRMGISKICKAVHLPSEFAREQHARKKHKAEWASYEGIRAREELAEARKQQAEQTEAMMALARNAAGPPPVERKARD